VYREIHAMPLLNHKNVVRYYSCWVEAIPPNPREIGKIVNSLNSGASKRNLKRGTAERTKPESSDIEEAEDFTLVDASLLE
jgi:hypothetical protein